MYLKKTLVFAFLLFFSLSSEAQERIFVFEHIKDTDGLPNNYINQFLQDRDGYLWITTFDGLIKYDGLHFENFRYNRLDSTSISDNTLGAIAQDSDGNIWICNHFGGLSIKRKESEQFISNKDPEFPKLSSQSLTSIATSRDGRIWIGGDQGLELVQIKHDKFEIVPTGIEFENENEESESIHSIFIDSHEQIWVGCDSGLYQLVYQNKWEAKKIFDKPVIFIREDRNGDLWFTTKEEKNRFYKLNQENSAIMSISNAVTERINSDVSMCFDKDNRLWYSEFGSGLKVYDPQLDLLVFESDKNSNLEGNRFFRPPFCDNDGNVWIGARGILKYNYPKGFNNYFLKKPENKNNSFLSFDGTYLWMGFNDFGMVRIHPETNEEVLYDFTKNGVEDPRLVMQMITIDDGLRLFISFNQVNLFDITSGQVIKTYPLSGTNRALYKDSQSRIWIGGITGLHLFDPLIGITKTYKIESESNSNRQFIQGITEDHSGKIYVISGTLGFAALDENVGRLIKIDLAAGHQSNLKQENINDMCFDRKKKVFWLGTESGVVKYEPSKKDIKIYDVNNGLKNDYIQALQLDLSNQLWVSTNSGLARLDETDESFTNYGIEDGLLNAIYYNRSKTALPDGQLFFGGQNGIDFFHPENLRTNSNPPRVVCSFVKVNGRYWTTDHPSDLSDGIHLNYDENFLELGFTSNHYSNPALNRYYYKINEVNEDWITLGTNPNLTLSNLQHGNYTLEVRTENPDGYSSRENLIIPIRIKPPFYLNTWFIMGISLLMIGGVFYFVRNRERQIKQKEQEKLRITNRINDLEKKALLAQMNPHFIFNCLNSIQDFMYNNEIEDAMTYLSKFSRIIRSVMNFSTQERISIQDEIQFIENYMELEKMRFSEGFDYEINIADQVDIYSEEIPPFFIQPQVENSIKHGLLNKSGKGLIQINLSKEVNHLKIEIIDNGVGRKKNEQNNQSEMIGTGLGTALTQERLKYLNTEKNYQSMQIIDLVDAQGNPAGTHVEFILPTD